MVQLLGCRLQWCYRQDVGEGKEYVGGAWEGGVSIGTPQTGGETTAVPQLEGRRRVKEMYSL